MPEAASNELKETFLSGARDESFARHMLHIDFAAIAKTYPDAVTWRNAEGMTALMIAAVNGVDEFVRILLDQGAEADARDNEGRTALMHAARNSQKLFFPIISLLVEKGADINATDNAGKTPLLIAAEGPYDAMVDFLLRSGANPGLGGADGRTATMLLRDLRDRIVTVDEGARHGRQGLKSLDLRRADGALVALEAASDARIAAMREGVDHAIAISKPLAFKFKN